MGEIADMIIDGEMCSWCGVCFVAPHGFPVACKSCWGDYQKDLKGRKKKHPKEHEQHGVVRATFPELGELAGDIKDMWKCTGCGEVVDLANGKITSKWRFNGDVWQHHHGYPVGHVDAKPLKPVDNKPDK